MLAYATHKIVPLLLICLLVGMTLVAFRRSGSPSLLDNLDPRMLGTLNAIANQDGISVETAAYKYGWQNDFALTVDRIRTAHPNSVTTSAVTGDRSARVDFAGALPSSATSEIETFGNNSMQT